jgi:hypothetical protein
MRMSTIATPVMRHNGVARTQPLRNEGARKVAASIIYNYDTKNHCDSACNAHGNFGVSHDSCVHHCYWEDEWWVGKCPGQRYC